MMRTICEKGVKNIFLFVVMVVVSMSSYATTYYVSNSGNDANSGLTVSLPWKTLAKVNATTFKAGDQILFNRGETFYGTITVSQSGSAGNVITYGAYGTGANPVITGFSTINSWTNLGSNIWESTSSVSNLSNCNMVTINGIQAPMGRYPNSGWLTYQTFSTNVSITSTDVNSAITNWTGAEVVIRKARWVIDRNPIALHSGSTINYSNGSFYSGQANYGFFIQNDIKTLDTQNEWYFNPTSKKIYIYSAFQPINVKVASVDNLIKAINRQYVNIDGLEFNGSNSDAIVLSNISGEQHINIVNCTIDNSGYNAISANNSTYLTIQNCKINHTNNTAISLDKFSTYASINNNAIQNTGLLVGLGGNENGACIGINSEASNVKIENNVIENTGFNGITFLESHVLVKNNFINNSNLFKDDGGSIYTYIGNSTTIHMDRQIIGNIILNAVGNGDGTAEGGVKSHGIYLDGYSINIDVVGNTVANTGSYGILMNASRNINFINNTSYNNSDQLYIYNWSPTIKASNINLKNNVFVSQNSKQRTLTFQAENSDLLNFGISDSNYYASVVSELAPIHIINAANSYILGKPYILKAWKSEFNKDNESKIKPKLRFEYDYTKISANKYANEKFSTISGTKGFSNCTPSWEANGNLDDGCLKISNPTQSKNAVVTFYVGAVEAGKNYLVKFSSISALNNSTMKVNFIENSSPYTQSTQQLTYLDTERMENQLLLTPTFSSSNVSVMLQLSNGDPTIWIDNLQIYEVTTADINLNEYVQFKYNNTLVAKTISLNMPMIDAKGIKYSNSITLQPFTSAVLMKDPSIYFTEYKSICDGSNYNNWTISGNYIRTLVAKSGVDSIVTTILTVNPKYAVSEDIAIQSGETYNGWSTSGTYTRTLSSKLGCDSVVTTNLTVESAKTGSINSTSTQTIELKKGYNMISTYVVATDPVVSVVTQPIVESGNLIKIQDESGNSYENWGSFGGWINNLGSIQKTEGYKIKVAENCTLQITGLPVALPLDIPLNSGWNIISFPKTDAMDAMVIIQSLIDQNKLVKVQDEAGNSIEDWGIYGGWKNGIGNFVPGKAYRVKMNAPAVLTILESYPKSATLPVYAEKTSYFNSQFEGNGVDHMNINLVGLREAGLTVGDELGAFDGDICVGTLKITSSNLTSASLVASSSTSSQLKDGFKDGTAIQIYAWNQMTGKESKVDLTSIKGSMNYLKNGSTLVKMKSLSTSVSLMNSGELQTEVYPNPSQGKFTVRFSALPEAGSKIEILDISGRKVASRLITGISEELNLYGQAAGLYLVKSILGTSETIQKLVIQ